MKSVEGPDPDNTPVSDHDMALPAKGVTPTIPFYNMFLLAEEDPDLNPVISVEVSFPRQ